MVREGIDRTFRASDGETLFFRHWPAARAPQGIVLLIHRGHEHSGRMAHLVDELALADYAFYAWDWRGQGRSRTPGSAAASLPRLIQDLDECARFAAAETGLSLSHIAVVAQSVGAVLAATWVHDYAPGIRALVLAAAAFQIKLYVPCAWGALRLWRAWRGDFTVTSYVKPQLLSHDPARVASYATDPLITRPVSVDLLLALHDAAKRIVADAAAIHTATQILISGQDWVVHARPQQQFFAALASPYKALHVLPGFFHDTLGERDRASAIALVRAFILQRFANPLPQPDLRDADRRGASFDSYRRLSQPLSWHSPKRWHYAATRLALHSIGRLSEGIRLGCAEGFDSGAMLDYVYRNSAQGRSELGRLIDRHYLDAPGWRGIRQRKAHLTQALQWAIGQLRLAAEPVHLADIAAGHGRYVVDTLLQLPQLPDSVVLRDLSAANVERGLALVARRRLQNRVQFEQGDAFDPAALATLQPPPNVVIVSGLYELFPDNAPVQASLTGLAQTMAPGGYLIYTNQPWHPQLELIARVLLSHRHGQAWVMRCRAQVEMDQLVAHAGFDKCSTLADEHGIFTVSIARRRR